VAKFHLQKLISAKHPHTELENPIHCLFGSLPGPLIICKTVFGRSGYKIKSRSSFCPRRLNPNHRSSVNVKEAFFFITFPGLALFYLIVISTLSVHGSWLVRVGKTIIRAFRHQVNSASTCIDTFLIRQHSQVSSCVE
jgi:hypothetical protein